MAEFFSKYKKVFMIIGFIAIVFILGYFIYSLFFAPTIAPPAEQGPTATTTAGGGLPQAGKGTGQIVKPGGESGLPLPGEEAGKTPSQTANGGLTKTTPLGDKTGLGATLDPDGSDLRYYNQDDGKFYRVDDNGNTSLLSEKVFHSIEKIVWSPDKNKAILEYPDGANIIYDFSSDKQITLQKHWKDFDFSPDGKQIVMKSMGLNPDNRWLAIINDDASKVRALESLGDKDATVYPSWSPNNQMVAMYTEGVDFDRQEVFFVGLNNENFKSTIVEGRGFQPKWAPEGDRLLYSVYSSANNYKPLLWIVNANGDSIGSGRKSLGVETWADKCAFASESDLYCAVPENLEEGAGMMPELAKTTKDNLYKIDTRTGLKKLVAVPDENFNMSNLIISQNGNNLYFTDATTKKLHKIQLK